MTKNCLLIGQSLMMVRALLLEPGLKVVLNRVSMEFIVKLTVVVVVGAMFASACPGTGSCSSRLPDLRVRPCPGWLAVLHPPDRLPGGSPDPADRVRRRVYRGESPGSCHRHDDPPRRTERSQHSGRLLGKSTDRTETTQHHQRADSNPWIKLDITSDTSLFRLQL